MKRRRVGRPVTGGLLSIVVCGLLAAATPTARVPGVTAGDGATPALGAGSAVECTDRAQVSLRVALAIASPRTRPLTDILRDEVTAIWQRHGVALKWIDVTSGTPLDTGVLRLIVQDDELTSSVGGPPYTVGWIRFVGGRPQNIVRVSRRTALAYVTRLLAKQETLPLEGLLTIPLYRDAFTRLLAWSLAHEIGHYVLSMPRHTTDGLMRRSFLPEDLIGGPRWAVALMPAEAARLQGWAAACRLAVLRAGR